MDRFPRSTERGYALVSVLLLTVLLFLLGTLVLRSIVNSQGMVNISGDIVTAQADGETKLMLKLSDLRVQIMNLQDQENRVTLEHVREAADSYVDSDSVMMDEESQRYTAVVSAQGRSGKITQTVQRRVEITLDYDPTGPSEGEDNNGYAVVSQGSMDMNGTVIEGSVYAGGALANNQSTVNGQKVTPVTPPMDGLSLPARMEVASLVSELDKQLSQSLSDLLHHSPTQPVNFEVSRNEHYPGSTTLRSLKLMDGKSLEVDGDLVIQGELTMQPGSSLSASGHIYINGNLMLNGSAEIHSGASIRVNGSINMNGNGSTPNKAVIEGDLYTNQININGTLTAGRIYVKSEVNGTLYNRSQFRIYAAGSVALNAGSFNSSSLLGYIYSNGSIHLNGNGKLTIEGTEINKQSPKQPADIVFIEGSL
ncbi:MULTISPECIES: hypothetical protein [unclassified Paenibacillus]|uniref:hypothetical protein n=1 Tax=unclassified Paenibacillus TaxID=185978 RepID=UPI00083966D0|nr:MULTISPECIES: hypothetical protein [unclassified Paenibacillus]NWL86334.1 hypothetical protein [Paenibacillus sp. 79R4]